MTGRGNVEIDGVGNFTVNNKVDIVGNFRVLNTGTFTNNRSIQVIGTFHRQNSTATRFVNNGLVLATGSQNVAFLQFNGNGGSFTAQDGSTVRAIRMIQPTPAPTTPPTRAIFRISDFPATLFNRAGEQVARWTIDQRGQGNAITGSFSDNGPLFAQWGPATPLVILDMGVGVNTDNYKAALWAIKEGYFYAAPATGGVNFSPNGTLTRKDAAVVMARFAGSREGDNSTMPSVVPPEMAGHRAQHVNAMIWARNAGLYGTWNPNGVVTRYELATMMFRHSKDPAPTDLSILDKFDDSDKIGKGQHDEVAMVWAINKGIFGGAGSLLRPDAPADRKDFAVVLWRYEGRP